MPGDTLTCPYCNSYVPVTARRAAGERMRCPRCHELLPTRLSETSAADNNSNANYEIPAASPIDVQASATSRRWDNRSVAAVVLSVMAVMALIGFLFAWYTTEWRRKRDRLSQSAEPLAAPATATTPSQWRGLGYLPADTDIVAGFEVGQMLSDAHGRDLLDTLLAVLNLHETDLESWTGIKIDDLDYALFGAKIQDRVLPRMTLVVETRRDYDQAKLQSKLKVGRRTERDGRTLFRFRPSETSLEATVWFAGERTLVFSLIPEDFAEVPVKPSAPSQALAPALIGLLQPMTDATHVWLIGQARNWGRLLAGLSTDPLPIPTLNLRDETRQLLPKVRQFAFWATVDDLVNLELAIGLEDRAAARRLERLIHDKEAEWQGDAEKPAQLKVHFQLEAKEEWLKGSTRMSTNALREVLAGLTTR